MEMVRYCTTQLGSEEEVSGELKSQCKMGLLKVREESKP